MWSALLTGGAAGTIREEFARIARDRGPSRIHLDGWLPLDLGVAYGVAATVEIIAWWLRNHPGDLPSDADPSEWTWQALVRWSIDRFELNLKEQDLKKYARSDGDEF